MQLRANSCRLQELPPRYACILTGQKFLITHLTCSVLVLLLRLRQVCAHPSLIQEEGVASIDEHQADTKNTDLARAERVVGLEFVRRMQAKFRQIMLARIAAEKAVRIFTP